LGRSSKQSQASKKGWKTRRENFDCDVKATKQDVAGNWRKNGQFTEEPLPAYRKSGKTWQRYDYEAGRWKRSSKPDPYEPSRTPGGLRRAGQFIREIDVVESIKLIDIAYEPDLVAIAPEVFADPVDFEFREIVIDVWDERRLREEIEPGRRYHVRIEGDPDTEVRVIKYCVTLQEALDVIDQLPGEIGYELWPNEEDGTAALAIIVPAHQIFPIEFEASGKIAAARIREAHQDNMNYLSIEAVMIKRPGRRRRKQKPAPPEPPSPRKKRRKGKRCAAKAASGKRCRNPVGPRRRKYCHVHTGRNRG